MADDAAAPGARRPDLGTEEGRRKFIGILNSRLPKKRNIAQGLVRNERGEILLCELAYKKDWDLPGGVVDPSESPATCVRREISEELGVDWAVGDLRAVNWLPPYRGWDDAVLCLFDLGEQPADVLDGMTLLAREIKAVHWCPPEGLEEHVAPYVARLLGSVLAAGPGTLYLEDGLPRA